MTNQLYCKNFSPYCILIDQADRAYRVDWIQIKTFIGLQRAWSPCKMKECQEIRQNDIQYKIKKDIKTTHILHKSLLQFLKRNELVFIIQKDKMIIYQFFFLSIFVIHLDKLNYKQLMFHSGYMNIKLT